MDLAFARKLAIAFEGECKGSFSASVLWGVRFALRRLMTRMLRLAAPVPRRDISVVANKQLQNLDVTVCSAVHESSVSSATRK
jgi:hypothetical protein